MYVLCYTPAGRAELTASRVLSFLQSIHPRAKRSPTIPAHLREVFDSARSAKAGSAEAVKFEKDIDNMVVFLNAHRIHKVCLAAHALRCFGSH